MPFFDAHNHLNDELFAQNWQQVVSQSQAAGVEGMLVNGAELVSSQRAVELAQQANGLWAAVGIHPEALPMPQDLKEQLTQLETLANSDKVVALGELGLDYTLSASRQDQLDLIEPQLALAETLNRPVVLHVRDVAGSRQCFEDILSLLDNFKLKGQFHCWTGDLTMMEQALKHDFYLSFAGILTYPSAGAMIDVAKQVPAERMLIETDGPYLVPEPKRTELSKAGARNNERLCLPHYVIMTAEKLAGIRGQTVVEIAEQTNSNARQLFGL